MLTFGSEGVEQYSAATVNRHLKEFQEKRMSARRIASMVGWNLLIL